MMLQPAYVIKFLKIKTHEVVLSFVMNTVLIGLAYDTLHVDLFYSIC